MNKSNDLKLFIGHKNPEFPIWKGYKYFGPEYLKAQPDNQRSELLDHRLLNEYAFLFQLRRQLGVNKDTPQLITLYQYRRFLVKEGIGVPSRNIPWANTLKTSEAIELGELISSMAGPPTNQQFQIGPVIKMPDSLLAQYARHHYCRDILRFCSDLVDAKVLTNQQAFDFLSQKIFIPTPSCGTFSFDFLNEALEILEKAAEVFLNNGYQKHADTYQGRVMGFLLERLNSHLLLEHLKSIGLDASMLSGKMIIISDDTAVKHGVIDPEANTLHR
jgi:hypothetical protein